MDINFKGKTVLITGGASGAGASIVKEFAKTGADIAFTYLHSSDKAEALIEELKDIKIRAYKLDQSKIEEIEPVIDEIMKDFNHIDILVNNAGIYPAKAFEEISEKDWDEMLDTNTKGVFFLSRCVAEKMKEGSIINISSINASNPAGKLIHYGISKAAIEMETKCLAQQLGPDIRVNCVAPGLIYKQGQEQFIPGWVESYSERAPLGRIVKPEEIGKACIFFASDLSSAVTGQILTVDCGIMLAPCFNNELRN